jgi:hypothetical protein
MGYTGGAPLIDRFAEKVIKKAHKDCFFDFWHKRDKTSKFNLRLMERTTGPQTISENTPQLRETDFCP